MEIPMIAQFTLTELLTVLSYHHRVATCGTSKYTIARNGYLRVSAMSSALSLFACTLRAIVLDLDVRLPVHRMRAGKSG